MSTITRFRGRDPFFADFDTLVRSTFANQPGQSGEALAFTPTAETVRDGDDVVVRLDLPGVDVAEDVTVEVTNGRLVVAGERKDAHAEESTGRSVREVRYGRFRRSFGLPGHVGADAVSAHYDQGVLNVRVAGVYAGTEPTRITIADGAPQVDQA
ncbi:Hsp20/alpha crystallin family protein [Aeromicrobium sp. Leaf350]|uniref:Hsp20/alpha crystallin family protein n=1 Tax=Aeromicrobium sp. Leaf350 TaxID=2876565 RepID=UPI001E5596E1|nr:Hsp20/alpha crystallin family protein [Aeromicrobium sp. Leaf350]